MLYDAYIRYSEDSEEIIFFTTIEAESEDQALKKLEEIKSERGIEYYEDLVRFN